MTTRLRHLAAVSLMLSCGAVMAEQAPAAKPDMKALQKVMKQQISLMTPDRQKQVMALSPETKGALMTIYAKHTRRSDTITLRQVMHEVLSDYQSIATGLMTDNGEQAAGAARRLANHRLPRGGLLPYFQPDQVNDEKLSVLVSFNDAVEGNALRLADAADKGDLSTAADYYKKVTDGCMACHATFRGVPGQTPYLR
ncbi:MAG: cytochrome c [Gammaproteobacteria bacterium]|nr:cytochrome c [Gammaproteobacteria bacterium]MCW8839692.1 cytochrome c [Gammaproteobacteria bacterium]MCW8928170.1 cytochrome c [Gammaproteobacteria bacterium]MCW8958302.1 cytochrome c [Gammaproteobacteria bacterium]MCW8972448.1 cytochrome c [Gammaproteobacteria bacterium]